MIDDEDERSSLTSRQLEILRGRKLSELSPVERIDFANAAGRPIPANKIPPVHCQCRIDPDKVRDKHPMIKIRAANDAQAAEQLLWEADRIKREIAMTSDPATCQRLQLKSRRLEDQAARILRRIQRYLGDAA